MMIKLGFHLIWSKYFGVIGNIVLLEINGPALVLTGLTNWTWRPGAIFALINI